MRTATRTTIGIPMTASFARGERRLHPVGSLRGRDREPDGVVAASRGATFRRPHRLHVHASVPAAAWNVAPHPEHCTKRHSVLQPAHVYPAVPGASRCSVVQRGQRTMFITGTAASYGGRDRIGRLVSSPGVVVGCHAWEPNRRRTSTGRGHANG